MKMIKYPLILAVLLSVVGCTTSTDTDVETPSHHIAGSWEYTLTASDGNVYDEGTIEFTGTSNQGKWTLLNFYDVEYDGTYTVNGNTISMAGDETWQGSFADDTHINGQWQNDEASGKWTAVKK